MPERAPLQAAVASALRAHGIEPSEDDTPESLRERLNDVYLAEVRRLKQRQKAGEIAKADYATHVQALRDRFPLLGLPVGRWTG